MSCLQMRECCIVEGIVCVWNSYKILEQDAGLITTQEDFFMRNTHRAMKEDYYYYQVVMHSLRPTVNGLIMLDRVCLAWFQGLSTRSMNINSDYLTRSISPLPPNLEFHVS